MELVRLQNSEKLEDWVLSQIYDFLSYSWIQILKKDMYLKVTVSIGVMIIIEVRFLTGFYENLFRHLYCYLVLWCGICARACGLKINCEGNECVRSVLTQGHRKRLGVFSRWSRTVWRKRFIEWLCKLRVNLWKKNTHSEVCLKPLSWLCCYFSKLEAQWSPRGGNFADSCSAYP